MEQGLSISDIESTRSPEDQSDGQRLVAYIQQGLMAIGLYPGPADGQMDLLTSDAIRTYQARHDLHRDGQPSYDLLQHIEIYVSDMQALLENGGELGSRAE